MNRSIFALVIAVIAASWSAIFIKFCHSSPIAIAAWRMLISTLLLIPAYLIAGPAVSTLTRRDKFLIVLSGIFLGAHFASWITSLNYTSIASATVLVTVQPLFLTILAQVILGERVDKWGYLAILLALIGSITISWGDFRLSGQQLVGDLLALAGALFAAVYLLIGRALIGKLGLFRYIVPVYGVAAVVLILSLVVSSGNFVVETNSDYFWFLMLAVVPTLFGHTLYNYALKRTKAQLVGISSLGEPILTGIWAWIVFSVYPTATTVFGGILIFTAIIFSFLHERKVSA